MIAHGRETDDVKELRWGESKNWMPKHSTERKMLRHPVSPKGVLLIVLLDLLKVSKITNFNYNLSKVSKMTNFNCGMFKASKMTNFHYDLFKVSKITNFNYDLFKVSKMCVLFL